MLVNEPAPAADDGPDNIFAQFVNLGWAKRGLCSDA
jgi:hypothetical protein